MLARLEAQHPRRLRSWLKWAVGLFLFGLITHGHFAGSGDAVHYMMVTRSLVRSGDLDLADDYADPRNIVGGGRLPAAPHALPGRGGVVRPVHDVGLPLLAAPCFGIAYWAADRLTEQLPEWLRRRARLDPWIMLRQLVSLGMILVTCALAAAFFDVCRILEAGNAAAFFGSLLLALSPPLSTHGYVFFTEVPSALLALLAYRTMVSGERPRTASALLAGGATGLLVLVHVRNIGLAVALTIVAVVRWRSHQRALMFWLAGLGFMLLIRTSLNWIFWGALLTTPHARLMPWPGLAPLAGEMTTRTLGLLVDQRHGLLPSAPVFLLVPAGWLMLLRSKPRIAWESVVLVALCLLPILMPMTNPHGWRGGWSPAARFLVPITPWLGLALLFALRSVPVGLVAILVGLQIGLDLLFWASPMTTWHEGPGLASFVQELGGDALASLLPVIGP